MNHIGRELLLHSCCAPCSSYCMEYLMNEYRITIYYYNPNIAPLAEYRKRLCEQRRLIKEMFAASAHEVKLMEGRYEAEKYEAFAYQLRDVKEGGERCTLCYALRLEDTARVASRNGFDFFATTLTVSPHKNADEINDIGQSMSNRYDIPYLPSNFKKKGGYQRSISLSKEYNLYRQNYCGCIYSLSAS